MRASLTAGVVIFCAGLSMVAFTVAKTDDAPREVSPFQRRAAVDGANPAQPAAPVDAEGADTRGSGRGQTGPAAEFPLEFRTIDGYGNNQLNPSWGSVGEAFIRRVPSAYGANDTPARAGGPSPRDVSNAMCAQASDMPNAHNVSDFLWQWGQFLDHDFAETPLADPPEPADIPIPNGDTFFDPFGLGTLIMPFDRSAYTTGAGSREQINLITSYIDASAVYGSEVHRADELRTNDGTGRLKTSAGELMPLNTAGLHNAEAGPIPSNQFFLAGDIRANEQTGLAAIHTLFVREHNHWADAFRASDPGLTGDEVYEYARAIVGAEMQAITYNEFLPILIGPDALPAYEGYRPDVNAGVTNVFATAGYRVGHTMLSPRIMRLSSDMTEAPEGHLSLRTAFFLPNQLKDHGITSVLRGLAGQRSQVIDSIVVDDIRNFLFGPPGSGGFDLASLNIQRGRDHGLGSYNDVREAFGMARAQGFADVNPDPAVMSALASVYAGPDEIDPWVGLLAEPHAAGAQVGETLRRVLVDQFVRLRDGDRFWYESYLPEHLAQMVERQTLGVIIRRNTAAGLEVPHDAFRVREAVTVDWNSDGAIDAGDVGAFMSSLAANEASADLNGDGEWGFFDAAAFLDAWSARQG
ncbi:MAG: peroxidase family protein [Planctomycetota bacterium]